MGRFPDGGTPGCHNLLPGWDRIDLNLGGVVDIEDHVAFVDCMSAPGGNPDPEEPNTIQQCLCAFDVNHDLDVDLADFIALQLTFGP